MQPILVAVHVRHDQFGSNSRLLRILGKVRPSDEISDNHVECGGFLEKNHERMTRRDVVFVSDAVLGAAACHPPPLPLHDANAVVCLHVAVDAAVPFCSPLVEDITSRLRVTLPRVYSAPFGFSDSEGFPISFLRS